MPGTSSEVEARYREGICIALRKDDRPCTQGSLPDSYRCKFHPEERYPRTYCTPPALLKEQPVAVKIANALAQAPAFEEPDFRLPADVLAGADEGDPSEADPSYAAAQAAQAQEETGEEGGETLGDVPPGMVRKAVFDSELGDYVVRVVPTETAAPARSADEYHDEFEIGPAYFQGDNAYFDYRWINDDPKRSLTDRKNGFVPVKKALDTLHREEGGCVRMGDLILARRPKDITAQRASEQSRLHDRIVGEVDEFNAEGRRAGVETFGGISAETDELPRARAQERVPEPRGRKSFAFPALPFQRDKVAERHGSVGG